MRDSPIILWFRRDLRLADNPALGAAAQRGQAVIPVFIHVPEEEGEWPPGAASDWWLHQSLARLDAQLRRLGSRLLIRRGASLDVLRTVVRESRARGVYRNRRYEPVSVQRDKGVETALREEGVEVESFNAGLLFEPWEIETGAGQPYRVFTPFWKACLRKGPPKRSLGAPGRLPAPRLWPDSLPLEALELEPAVDWTGGLRKAWHPGEEGVRKQLVLFFGKNLEGYADDRDRPGLEATSRLSAHLHFGEIGPRQIWAAASEARGADPYLRQVGWREFAHHLLYHFPETAGAPLRAEFADFPWLEDRRSLRLWQQGRTGYPLVDAGMRQLWKTGWMHNRVRMVAASFLVKDLLISWRAGARWFWDTLVDADLANNTLGWQWTAGCGADAAPFFRIFNPVTQGERFDTQGEYVRRWVPELERLPDRWIYRPWEAPAEILRTSGVELGRTYPEPIVDHGFARQRALEALEMVGKS